MEVITVCFFCLKSFAHTGDSHGYVVDGMNIVKVCDDCNGDAHEFKNCAGWKTLNEDRLLTILVSDYEIERQCAKLETERRNEKL